MNPAEYGLDPDTQPRPHRITEDAPRTTLHQGQRMYSLDIRTGHLRGAWTEEPITSLTQQAGCLVLKYEVTLDFRPRWHYTTPPELRAEQAERHLSTGDCRCGFYVLDKVDVDRNPTGIPFGLNPFEMQCIGVLAHVTYWGRCADHIVPEQSVYRVRRNTQYVAGYGVVTRERLEEVLIPEGVVHRVQFVRIEALDIPRGTPEATLALLERNYPGLSYQLKEPLYGD